MEATTDLKTNQPLNAQLINIDEISEPEKSIRFSIDESSLYELQLNISQNGLLQPILLRDKNGYDSYQIIAGHRRYLACKNIGLKQIPATITSATDSALAIMRASENLARVNLSPVEEAEIYSELSKKHKLAYADIAIKFGKTKNIIIDRIQLLNLPKNILQAIHEKKITQSVGKEFLNFDDPRSQSYYFDHAMESGANVKTIRQWIVDYKREKLNAENPLDTITPPTTSEYNTPKQYFECDGCHKPEEYGNETILRLCRNCMNPEQKSEVG